MTSQPAPPSRTIRIETPHYIVRTVDASDATERWCKWLLDPATCRQLNMAPTEMSMDRLRAYIARFDRSTSHLLGIFEKESGLIVGIRSIYVDHGAKAFLDNILIGEVEARGKHARAESTDAIQPYFFEALGLESARCTILGHNSHMLEIVARKGWVHEHSDFKPIAGGGQMVEIRHYRLTRETWRRRMRERAARQS